MANNLKQIGLAAHNYDAAARNDDAFDFTPAEGGETAAICHGTTVLAWARVDGVSGDVSGDGVDDVLVGVGTGGGPHVRAFEGDPGSLGIEVHTVRHEVLNDFL